MEQSGYQKFSLLLTSPCVAVIVGSGDEQKTFYLHEALLCYESERFVKQLKGGFKESTTRSIPECDENPDLFRYFAEYLYRDGWVNNASVMNDHEFITLARLYTMGERLGADRFQKYVLCKFLGNFHSGIKLPLQGICDLLHIACTELPERVPEDPLRDLVFWFAATRLNMLRVHPDFQKMLLEIPDLGRYMCLRAGNGEYRPPQYKIQKPYSRFKKEEDP